VEQDRNAVVIACSLGPTDFRERLARCRRCERTRQRAGTHEEWFRLAFRAEEGVAEELEALAELERDCCAFAS
jgi:hypothetical protein